MASSQSNRIISYFFIFDFYHHKGTNDEHDLFPESIIYFYPTREDIKKEKLHTCGEMIGLIQYTKYDLFGAIPKEFYYKKSVVTNEFYGRHCVFLVLSKDRFTIDESNVHLTHILQLFHSLYGTLNHILSIYTDIQELHLYLKQTLTPIVEHVFNQNRSIRNLFSAIDYAPIRKNNQRFLLHVKHFLNHLQTSFGVRNGFFAFDKRIIYTTYDIDTTYYLQVILDLERHLPINEIYLPLRSETKLRSGVSLLRIFLPRTPTFDSFLNSLKANTIYNSNEDLPLQLTTLNINHNNREFHNRTHSRSISNDSHSNIIIREEPISSPDDYLDCETDLTVDTSASTENDSLPVVPKSSPSVIVHKPHRTVFSSTNNDECLTDDQKKYNQTHRSRSGTLNDRLEDSLKSDGDLSNYDDRLTRAEFVVVANNSDFDSCDEICPENTIQVSQPIVQTNFYRQRRKMTLTNDAEHVQTTTTMNNESTNKFGDVPELNDEIDREELVLYVQKNSRMTFTGVVEKNLVTDEYLQKLWWLIVNEVAELDRDIQVLPIAGETNKDKSDIKFQFHDHTHQVQYERIYNVNKIYDKIPSSDGACMAFNARMKMNEDSERKMIGLSRGNNVITVNRYIPDRVTYLHRRVQEPR